jgi:hypothetical protein
VEVTHKDGANADASTGGGGGGGGGPVYRQGVVIELETQFRKAKVVYRDCPKRTAHSVEQSFETLRAVPEVVLASSFFSHQLVDLLAVLLFFLQTKVAHEFGSKLDESDHTSTNTLLHSWDALYAQMKSCSVIALTSLLAEASAVSLFVEKGKLPLPLSLSLSGSLSLSPPTS